MTRDDVIEQIGKKLTGSFECHDTDEVRTVIDVLKELGYRWQILYKVTGTSAIVTYMFDPR